MIWRTVLALVFAAWASAAAAQFFPFLGPGRAPFSGGGGCTINGSLDFSGSSSCNMIFYMTGVIQ